MTLAAGLLRHRIRIEDYTNVLDSSGDPIQDPVTGEILMEWALFAEVWAEVAPLSAREFIASQATQSRVSTRITVRYMAGITAAMRIIFRGQIFNIEGILTDKVSGLEYITMPCSQGVSVDGQ